ncbi:signal peptide peptidase SppA [Sulfurospirillum arcachonense]|uniref:signal peptide peptidase SppA n=1 Tax=Sulfurospirillum arcachonense TaxID=57666 RepID=UPI000468C3FF|nr:signal peptide peptidase SppA [Sulfurospirillum arcachonense]
MIIFRWIGNFISYIHNHFKAMLFLLLLFFIFNPLNKETLQKANLATIRIEGQINQIDTILANIEKAALNKNIKGVLLRVDSPGGALAPSIELSMAVKRLNQIKPVVAYAAGSMTSGSYYASIWSKKIIANPGAFIGSIGVLFQAPNIKSLADKLGISEQVITAGEYKQMGTFTREWNEKEKMALKELISDAYTLFTTDVANARNLKIEDTKSFANARVFIAQKAKKEGLIDEVGSLYTAQLELEKISGVQNPIWEKPSEMDMFLQELKGVNALSFFNIKSSLR